MILSMSDRSTVIPVTGWPPSHGKPDYNHDKCKEKQKMNYCTQTVKKKANDPDYYQDERNYI
jgi:hypothetical protein